MKFIQTTALGLVLALGLLAYNTQAATNGDDEGEATTSTTRRRELTQEEAKAAIIAKATQAGFSLKARAENVRLFLEEQGAPVVSSAPLAAVQTFVKSAKGEADLETLLNAFIRQEERAPRLRTDFEEGFGAFGEGSRRSGLGLEGFSAFGDSSTASRRPQGLGLEGFDEGFRPDRRTADRRPLVTADRRPLVAEEAAEGFLRGLETRVDELAEDERATARTALDLGRRGLEENRALREEVETLHARLRTEAQRSAAELRAREDALAQSRTQLAQRQQEIAAITTERDALRTQLAARPAVDVEALRTQIATLTAERDANEQDSLAANEAQEAQTNRIQAILRGEGSDRVKLVAIRAALTAAPAAEDEEVGEE